MTNIPTVSVITPMYNGERYLAECIESVLAQTRSDWEYLIVDNQSQDQSVAIATRYANLDSRIRVVRCDEFVNVHRNFCRGARLMDVNSRYCKFLSADDWLYPECLEKMISIADKYPKVGIVSSYRLVADRLDHDRLIPYTQDVISGAEVIRSALFCGPYVTGSPSQLLFRAELVRRSSSFFDETVWHSDTDAAFRTLLESDLGFVHQVLTFTRLHAGSLTSSFSHRVNTYLPMEMRMLIRYGPKVLNQREYRAAMRTWLRRYGWYLCKQNLKWSRLRDEKFHSYHHAEISRMLAELGDDRETRIALTALQFMLREPRATTAAGDEQKNQPHV